MRIGIGEAVQARMKSKISWEPIPIWEAWWSIREHAELHEERMRRLNELFWGKVQDIVSK